MFTRPASTVSQNDLQRLREGDWCSIERPATRKGMITTQISHIGQVQDVDSESITLNHVSTSRSHHHALANLPGSLIKNTGTTEQEVSVILPRAQVISIRTMTAQQAAAMSDPYTNIRAIQALEHRENTLDSR